MPDAPTKPIIIGSTIIDPRLDASSGVLRASPAKAPMSPSVAKGGLKGK